MSVTTQGWNEAVLEKHPWLDELIDRDLTERIAFARVSPELLEIVPSEDVGTDASCYWTQDRVTFHDSEGNELGEVDSRVSHADAREMNHDHRGESIGDGISRYSLPAASSILSRIAYIVRWEYEHAGVLSHGPSSGKLTVYRSGGFDFTKWIETRRAAAKDSIAGFGSDVAELVDMLRTNNCHGASYTFHTRDCDGGHSRSGESGDLRVLQLWETRADYPQLRGLRTSSADIQLLGWYDEGGPEEDEEGNEIGPDPTFYLKYSSGREAASVRPLTGGCWHRIEVLVTEILKNT